MEEDTRLRSKWRLSETKQYHLVSPARFTGAFIDSGDAKRVGGADQVQGLNTVIPDKTDTNRFQFANLNRFTDCLKRHSSDKSGRDENPLSQKTNDGVNA